MERLTETANREYGLAMDLGTTTVALALVDLQEGSVLAEEGDLNPQTDFGPDVLSRITYACQKGPEGRKALQRAAVRGLNEALFRLLGRTGLLPQQVTRAAVSGNTVMIHLLLGEDPEGLGFAPFEPAFTGARTVAAGDLGLALEERTAVYCLPCASAYLGGDAVAGAWIVGLHKTLSTRLLVDIGTNGELLLARNGELYGCSCAAGPALEGNSLSCGMRAGKGAIEEAVLLPDGSWHLHTIGERAPVGLCGSGALAVTAALLASGRLTNDGFFEEETVLLHEGAGYRITITQRDIRQLQLAKGALLSGVTALLQAVGVTAKDVQEVAIAGNFGSHLSRDLLVQTGILPPEVKEAVSYRGNTALQGACAALLSAEARSEMERLARRIQVVELADFPGYDSLFLEALAFPDPHNNKSGGIF